MIKIDLLYYFTAVKPGSFEDAIKATGFGKFNLVLLCVLITAGFAQISEQTGMAYVTPIAECDLKLSLEQKGLLVSVSYTGKYLTKKYFSINQSFFLM